MVYYKFSDYLKKRYHKKVYKLPINIPSDCPNRDGTIDKKPCIFCGDIGAGYENLPNTLSVKEQLLINSEYLKKRYKPEKYIAYFQNYSNTYVCFDDFVQYVKDVIIDDVVAIYISTRPDCITDSQLDFLMDIKDKESIDIVIEIGLQTVNYVTLQKLNRNHSLAEFIDSVMRIKKRNLEICSHVILDIPYDNIIDVIETSKIISALKIDQVKCHSLYIVKDSQISNFYENGEIKLLSLDNFVDRAIKFLEYLSPEIAVQRIVGRAPKEATNICNWNISWWKIHDMIINKMIDENQYQGRLYNYLIPHEKI